MFSEILAYKDKLAKLQPLKVDDVLESLQRNSVAILGTDSAKVVSDFDIYSTVPSQSGGAPVTTFNGEQAISSALLAMTHPDKVKVVFIGLSSQRQQHVQRHQRHAQVARTLTRWIGVLPRLRPAGRRQSLPSRRLKARESYGSSSFPPEPDPQMAAMGMPPKPPTPSRSSTPPASTLPTADKCCSSPKPPSTIPPWDRPAADSPIRIS